MIPFVQQGAPALMAAFVLGHVLADFPLQGEYLARQKNRALADSTESWIVALSAHSIIHAGAVWLISGSLVFAGIELLLHATIDTAKCQNRIGYATDQLLHLACKALYVTALLWI